MRRGTAITLIILFVLLVVTAVSQFVIASREQAPYPGPTQIGQLPPPPVTGTPAP